MKFSRAPSACRVEFSDERLVDAVDCFRHYLLPTHFIMETDYRALSFLNSAKHHYGRLARWALRLHPLSFDVNYRPCPQNANADALFRQAWDTETEDELQTFPKGGGGVVTTAQ